MINHLFEQTDEMIFFLPVKKIKAADKRTERSIEQCVKYENKYRKQKKVAGMAMEADETYERFTESLKKYREVNAQKDSQRVKQLEKKQEEERIKREPLTSDEYWNIYRLKYESLGKEYDDEPE